VLPVNPISTALPFFFLNFPNGTVCNEIKKIKLAIIPNHCNIEMRFFIIKFEN